MKKAILVFASLFLMAQSNYAQDIKGLPASERAARQTEWMKTNLNLSGDQLSRVSDINMRYANKMDEIVHSTKGKPEKKSEARNLSEQKDGELKGIFSESQYSAYRAKKQEIKERMK
jgi:hypothetical protein